MIEVRNKARLKAWESGGSLFINHGKPTPHQAWIKAFNLGFDAGRDSVVFEPHSAYRDMLRQMICEDDFDFTKIFEEIEYEGEIYTDISNEGADSLADYFIGLMEQIDERRSEDAGYSAAESRTCKTAAAINAPKVCVCGHGKSKHKPCGVQAGGAKWVCFETDDRNLPSCDCEEYISEEELG